MVSDATPRIGTCLWTADERDGLIGCCRHRSLSGSAWRRACKTTAGCCCGIVLLRQTSRTSFVTPLSQHCIALHHQ